MKIYVGRWDLLPDEWEGIMGLCKKSEEEIETEISREVDVMVNKYHEDDCNIAIYTPEEFEWTFNEIQHNPIDAETYWVRMF